MDTEKKLCFFSSLVLIFFIYHYFKTITASSLESYSDYHVDYPKDFYPQYFPEKQNEFLHKIPNDDTLSTRHFRKRYYNRVTPECKLTKTCPTGHWTNRYLRSPGFSIGADQQYPNKIDKNNTQTYFKNHLNYYEDRPLLKHESLGYSIGGIPYADYEFDHPKQPSTLKSYLSNRIPDVKEPEFPDEYPEWFEYTPQKSAKYYGFPYGGKIHN